MINFGKWISNPEPGEEVVISGISGRFPESDNVNEFKNNLFAKKDLVTDDGRRWVVQHPEIPRRNAKINQIDKIDAAYFGLHYRQADIMDPMMRKFLEVAIEAILDAGTNPSDLKGTKTGIFVGACNAEMEPEILANITEPQKFGITGYLRSFLAHRLSYYLRLKGPSVILDTACSSSSNALEQAIQSIRMGICDQALVGGVNLLQHPEGTRHFFRLGVLSADGKCKVFDEKADGYVRGETVACVFLQRAKDSKRVYGEIIHSKANSDGFKSFGITFPSTQMQTELMSEVLKESRVDASDISFMEAHGTGTEVGDPQEVEAIDLAIAKHRNSPLLIGSVKCSVGHTEPASGLCSLAKVIIALDSGFIPPNIHLEKVKGLSGFEEKRLIPVTEVTELEKDDAIIGINNFGFGGSNCHVLVKRNTKSKKNKGLPDDDIPRLICVSGTTKQAVKKIVETLNNNQLDVEQVGLLHHIFRKEVEGHLYRGFTILSKQGPISSKILEFTKKKELRLVFGKFNKGYKTLGQYLIRFNGFNSTIQKVNKVLSKEIVSQFSKGDDLFGSFAVQIGIADLLKTLGLEPNAVYGEDLGKIVAAYYCNFITLEQAIDTLIKTVRNEKNSKIAIEKLENNIQTDSNPIRYTTSTTLTISDDIENRKNTIYFMENNEVQFLKVLGTLYQDGHNLHLQNLYPKIKFPVSRNTPMIAPLIQWNHQKSWYTFYYGEDSKVGITQNEHNVSADIYNEQKFLKGHVIDGRNLIPATEYLHMVRLSFMKSFKMTKIESLPVIFENCKFIKAVNIPKKGVVKLLISIQKSSGNFEIVEKKSVIVSGRILLAESNIEKNQKDFPETEMKNERSEYLDKDEIYRELYIRGYNYSGLFKGIVRCNVDASVALIKWENNWTAFMDKMLQLKILQIDTRSLYVPVSIRRVTLNFTKHFDFLKNVEDSLCPVYVNKKTNTIKCGGIEISGIKATAIQRKKPTTTPVLEKHVFVPNCVKLESQHSLRVITQFVLENSLETNFKAVEIANDSDKKISFSLLILQALNNLPSVKVNLTISSKSNVEAPPEIKIENFIFTSTSNLLLIIGSNLYQNHTINQLSTSLLSKGFMLSRETIDFVPETFENVEIYLEHIVDDEKLILFRKVKPTSLDFIKVASEDFSWVSNLQASLKNEKDVMVFNKNESPDGLLGFVNCLRREPDGHKVKCLFTMSESPQFDPELPFYQKQIKKQAAINVYKDGKWGTYRHLLLEENEEIEAEHFFVTNTVKGDLNSLKWIKGSLTKNTKLPDDRILIYSTHAAMNFKDVMIASGRVSIDAFTLDRTLHENILGFEFSGIDINGRRVFGLVTNGAQSSIIAAEKNFVWEVPDHWSLEDAATITVTYTTVLYGFFKVIDIKSKKTILIHSATGGVGLAALNVCLHFGITVYCTVGTQEKRDFLKQHYPSIPESHIASSRDNSFEEMIKKQTNGRGVDVVLNSLSEEKLEASVRCLAKGGSFLEIGKYDLHNDSSLKLFLLKKNCSYHGVMLDKAYTERIELKKWLRKIILEGIREEYIKPLPKKIFKKEEIVDAYKHMTTGQHIGKVIIKLRDEADLKTIQHSVLKGSPRFTCDVEKTYIIIGGLGGFGLELADWFYLRGAKKIVLVSRNGVQTGYQRQRINIWTSGGVKVVVSTEDVTTKQGCLKLIQDAQKLGPIEAIFNLAVVLKDALFQDQNQETFKISLAPKAKATIYLDQISREHCSKLKYFVVFSSVSCGRGNAGQTNYGMANSIMERVCERRKENGLPGLAIQWGAIGDVGLVAKMQKENKELVIGGTLQQKILSCLSVLDTFLNQDSPIVSSMVVAEKNNLKNSGSAVDTVAYILGVKDIKTVGINTSFAELGMDSMMGAEMMQTLENDFEIYVTAKELRNLTFAKLIELETQQKPGAKKKIEKGTDILLKYIPKGLSSSPFVQIPNSLDDSSEGPTVILLPGVEGVFEGMDLLTKTLNAHIFGVEYSYFKDSHTLAEFSEPICQLIEEKITKEKKLFLIGHSFGVNVATELVALLEAKDYDVVLIALDGAPSYLKMATLQNFPEDDENVVQTTLLLKIWSLLLPTEQFLEHREKILKCKNFDERIDLAMSLAPAEVIKEKDLQKSAVIALYNRFNFMRNYQYSHSKIKSKVYLYRAKNSLISEFDEDYKFNEICEEKVDVNIIDGDHSSILQDQNMVEQINKIMAL